MGKNSSEKIDKTNVRYCPLRLIAVATDTDDRLRNDYIGTDCPQNEECAWWSTHADGCVLFDLVDRLRSIAFSTDRMSDTQL
jgi:hypothetical protein